MCEFLGLLTSLSSDEDQNWMCTSTSKGILNCWDLRFGIPVNTIKTDTPIRKLKSSSLHPWGVFSCPRYQNEASLWNLETGILLILQISRSSIIKFELNIILTF